jgi:uncharacterized membrane protein YdbT with pleckstrin-like domain
VASYVDSNLSRGEQVLYRGKLHWCFAGGWFFFGILTLPLYGIGILLIVGAALGLFLARKSTEIAVTNQRLILKIGLFQSRTLELKLAKVESMAVTQSLLGKLFGFGTVTVIGTGGTREGFSSVAHPLALRRALNDAGDMSPHEQAPRVLAGR